MSYFLTVVGPFSSAGEPLATYLLPVGASQSYVAGLQESIQRLDGHPLFLLHDGSSGTSSGLVGEAQTEYLEGRDVTSSRLFQALTRFADGERSFRLWWANNDPNAFLNVVDVTERPQLLPSLIAVFENRLTGLRFRASPPTEAN